MTTLTLKDFEGWKGWDKFCARPTFSSTDAKKKKEKLLQMARNGELRPHQTKHTLGKSLCHYSSPKSKCYDPELIAELKSIAPEWFIHQTDRAKNNKQEIIQIGKDGKAKPTKKHPLGNVLYLYTNPKSETYDKEFSKEIRELRPDWFITPAERMRKTKSEIIKMARNGEDKPHYKNHKFGSVFYSYTDPKHSSYDQSFVDQINELAPDWLKKRKKKNEKSLA